jgi:hypothetical protein
VKKYEFGLMDGQQLSFQDGQIYLTELLVEKLLPLKILYLKMEYRILIAPDEDDKHKWPKQLSIGSGAQTMALLNEVPIWYEVWRTLNGFPPNYYKTTKEKSKDVSEK